MRRCPCSTPRLSPRPSSAMMFSGLPLAFACSSAMRRSTLDLLGRHSVLVDGDRSGAGDVQRDLLREILEVVGARDEVRLAVDLDQHADLAVVMDVARDQALRWSACPRACRPWRFPSCEDARRPCPCRPSFSSRAFLHSIMPAPVRWRSVLYVLCCKHFHGRSPMFVPCAVMKTPPAT